MIDIVRAKVVDDALIEALHRLLPQLSAHAQVPSVERMTQLLAKESAHLFVAREEQGEIVGMLTLLFVDIPTGRKAWIEDVVTDFVARGKGVGQALVERAIEVARAEGAKRIYLTSNPKREAAHALYRRCGFIPYDTTVFRLEL